MHVLARNPFYLNCVTSYKAFLDCESQNMEQFTLNMTDSGNDSLFVTINLTSDPPKLVKSSIKGYEDLQQDAWHRDSENWALFRPG